MAAQIPVRRKLAYTAVVLFLSVILAEVVVRVAITVLRGPLVYETDVLLGYRLRSGLDVCSNRHGETWCFRTDSEGRRVVPNNPSRDETRTLVILGDSFAFGEGVDDDETVAAHLSRNGFHVINLGVQGYGTHQQLMAFRRFLEDDKADYVVTLTHSNDVRDVLSSYLHLRHRPTASIEGGQLRLDDFRPPITDYLIDSSYVGALLRYPFNQPERNVGDGPAIVAACLSAIQADALRAGSIPRLFFHDAKQGEQAPRLLEAFEERSLTVVDLTRALLADQRNVIGPDRSHWNAIGHRIVADAILAAGWEDPI